MHKLLISQVRDVTQEAERQKDLYQAFEILSVLEVNRPFDIQPAWDDLVRRGPTWQKYGEAGLTAIQKRYGKLHYGWL